MKPLLALFTCHGYNYELPNSVCGQKHPVRDRRPAIKATWLRDVDIPYRWFFGRQTEVPMLPKHDEVFLDCGDNYDSGMYKTQSIARWALAHGYDRVFKVDDDTYIHWDRFKQLPAFNTAEYSGGCWDGSTFAFGGAYAMAGRLLEAVASEPIRVGTWAEDSWVGDVAKANKIPFVRDDAFYFGRVNPYTQENEVTMDMLIANHNYATLNPLTPEQMIHYHQLIK